MSRQTLSRPLPRPTLGTTEPRPTALLIRLLSGLFAAAMMTAPAALWANQVYKPCGKKWVRQVSKLDAEKLAWMSEGRKAQATTDLDGDGLPDSIVMANTPSFRNCEVKRLWDRRETTVRIEYGNGKTRVFYWISGVRVERMVLYPEKGRILMAGIDAQGQPASRWVEYETPRPLPQTAVAAVAPQPAEGVLSLASVTPPR